MKKILSILLSLFVFSNCGNWFIHRKPYPFYFTQDMKTVTTIYTTDSLHLKLSIEVDKKLNTDSSKVLRYIYAVLLMENKSNFKQNIQLQKIEAKLVYKKKSNIFFQSLDTVLYSKIINSHSSEILKIVFPINEINSPKFNFEEYNLEINFKTIIVNAIMQQEKKAYFICKTH